MDYYLVFLLILPLMWLSIRVLTSKLASQTLPPGPKPFPIIGNFLELSNLPHRDLAKLSKTYGPLMTPKLGSITTIVISSPNLAKEALQKNDQAFSSRTIPDMARVFDHHEFSVGWLPTNSKWKNLRKACATQIFATQRLDATQALRQTKVQELIDHVNQSCQSGSPIDIGRVVFTTVLNSISNTFFLYGHGPMWLSVVPRVPGPCVWCCRRNGKAKYCRLFPSTLISWPPRCKQKDKDLLHTNFRDFWWYHQAKTTIKSFINEFWSKQRCTRFTPQSHWRW